MVAEMTERTKFNINCTANMANLCIDRKITARAKSKSRMITKYRYILYFFFLITKPHDMHIRSNDRKSQKSCFGTFSLRSFTVQWQSVYYSYMRSATAKLPHQFQPNSTRPSTYCGLCTWAKFAINDCLVFQSTFSNAC